MGSLKEVRLPGTGSALSAHGTPQLLIWSENRSETSEEVLVIIRAWLAGRFALTPQQVKDVTQHTGDNPDVLHAVRLELLGTEVVFAWYCSDTYSETDADWWHDIFLPRLKEKWPGIKEVNG